MTKNVYIDMKKYVLQIELFGELVFISHWFEAGNANI